MRNKKFFAIIIMMILFGGMSVSLFAENVFLGYFRDRFYDMTDLFRVQIKVPKNPYCIDINARCTALGQVGVGYFEGYNLGFDRRGAGLWREDKYEGGISLFYGIDIQNQMYFGNSFTKPKEPWTKFIKRGIFRNEPSWDDGRNQPTSIGARAQFFFIPGIDVGFYPEEVFDLVTGFIGMDIKDDDLLRINMIVEEQQLLKEEDSEEESEVLDVMSPETESNTKDDNNLLVSEELSDEKPLAKEAKKEKATLKKRGAKEEIRKSSKSNEIVPEKLSSEDVKKAEDVKKSEEVKEIEITKDDIEPVKQGKTENNSAKPKSADAKAADIKAAEPKAIDTKTKDNKPADTKPADSNPANIKPAEPNSQQKNAIQKMREKVQAEQGKPTQKQPQIKKPEPPKPVQQPAVNNAQPPQTPAQTPANAAVTANQTPLPEPEPIEKIQQEKALQK